MLPHLGGLDITQPLTDHPLNRGRKLWLLATPYTWGKGVFWPSLAGDIDGATLNSGALDVKAFWSYLDGRCCLEFQQSGSTLYADFTPPVANVDALTISMWLRSDQVGNIFGIWDAGKQTLWRYSSGLQVFLRNGADSAEAGLTAALGNNVWTHCVLTADGSTLRLYTNGVDQANTALSGPYIPAAGPNWRLSDPRDTGTDDYAFDDVSVWDRALAAGEVADLYHDSLTGYWQTLNFGRKVASIPPPSAFSATMSATIGGATLSGTAAAGFDATGSFSVGGATISATGTADYIGTAANLATGGATFAGTAAVGFDGTAANLATGGMSITGTATTSASSSSGTAANLATGGMSLAGTAAVGFAGTAASLSTGGAIFSGSQATVAGQYIATPMDPWIPNPCYGSTNVTIANGDWDAGATWSMGVPPTATDDVRILHTVTIQDNAAVVGHCLVEEAGKLIYNPSNTTKLVADTIVVLGELIIGTTAGPVTGQADTEWRDTALDIGTIPSPGLDPGEYLQGLLVLQNGKFHCHGTLKTPYVRCGTEVTAGATVITLASAPTGWQVGDTISIPDTRLLDDNNSPRRNGQVFPSAQWETRTISAIAGADITLSSALTYDHLGVRDGVSNALLKLPHVINRTRNVHFYSANGAGTRGHALFQGASDIDIRYSQWTEMGRTLNNSEADSTTFDGSGNPTALATNHIARYPIHFHHCYGVPQPNTYQYNLIGNVVEGDESQLPNFKWAYAIHASHYGLIQQNIAYNMAGGLFTFEDGSEYRNMVDGNFAMRASSIGTGWRYSSFDGGGAGGGTQPSGREAAGFWFRGPMNYVRNNIAANILSYDENETGYGYKFIQVYLGNVTVPATKGASPMTNGTTMYANHEHIYEFDNNEVYGATENGLTAWWVNAYDRQLNLTGTRTTISNFYNWHLNDKVVFAYPMANVTFLNWQSRGGGTIVFYPGDYAMEGIIIDTCTFDGARNVGGTAIGVYGLESGSGTFLVQDCTFKDCDKAIRRQPFLQTNDATDLGPLVTEVRNCTFTSCTVNIDQPAGPTTSLYNVVQLEEFRVFDFNGTPGDDFQCYYSWQEPGDVMFEYIGTRQIGSPEIGQTNQYNWDTYRMASAGSLSPADANSARLATHKVTGLTGRRNDLISMYKANSTLDRINRIRVGVWDDDLPSILTVPTSTDEFLVVLQQAPTGDVTITFSSSDTNVATISPSSLTFTSANWATPQAITVTGGGTPGSAQITSGTATSTDTNYSGYIARTDRTGDYLEVLNSVAAPLLYDCGTPTSPLTATYTRLDEADTYNNTTGDYGWTSDAGLDSRNRAGPDDLRRDFIFRAASTSWSFTGHVTPGDYVVSLTHGDTDGGSYAAETVTINGASWTLSPGPANSQVTDQTAVSLSSARLQIDFDDADLRLCAIELTPISTSGSFTIGGVQFFGQEALDEYDLRTNDAWTETNDVTKTAEASATQGSHWVMIPRPGGGLTDVGQLDQSLFVAAGTYLVYGRYYTSGAVDTGEVNIDSGTTQLAMDPREYGGYSSGVTLSVDGSNYGGFALLGTHQQLADATINVAVATHTQPEDTSTMFFDMLRLTRLPTATASLFVGGVTFVGVVDAVPTRTATANSLQVGGVTLNATAAVGFDATAANLQIGGVTITGDADVGFDATASLQIGGAQFYGLTLWASTGTIAVTIGGAQFTGTAILPHIAAGSFTVGGAQFAGTVATVTTHIGTAANLQVGSITFVSTATLSATPVTATASLTIGGVIFVGTELLTRTHIDITLQLDRRLPRFALTI